MYTQCPECATVFPVSADALSISQGNVRCGACGQVFFAVQSLSESLDEDGQIPTCFHSDHPPTLNDPNSEAPPIDDLFWPTPPVVKTAATEAPPDPAVTPEEAELEREFDRLIGTADSAEPDAIEDSDSARERGNSRANQQENVQPAPGADTPLKGKADRSNHGRESKPGAEPWSGKTRDADQSAPMDAPQAAPPGKTGAAGQKASFDLDDNLNLKLPELEPNPDQALPEAFLAEVSAPTRAAEDTADVDPGEAPVSGVAFELAAERASRQRARGTWLWGLCSGLALITLAGQWFAGEHDRLARNDTLRPWVLRACNVLDCRIELPADLSRIALISRSIEPHPSVEGALLISATLQNQASFPQPHPVVEIAMADLSGRAIAMRRFTPGDYLESPEPDGMTPGHLLPLVFEVIDPGRSAVAFEFAFR